MRILMTADTVGGVWTYAMDLARALAQYEVEIALATMGAPLTAEQRRHAESLRHVTVFESAFKLEWMEEPWDEVWAAGQWLLEIERKFRPDLVHLNGYAHGSLPWKAPVLVAAHSCVCSWWEAVKGEAAPKQWDRYRAAVRVGLRSAARVVAPSWAMLDALKRHYGSLPPARVIPNGRDAAILRPARKEPYIFSAGRLWDEAKNIAALDRVAPRVSWPMFVAGDDRGDGSFKHLKHLGKLEPAAMADRLAHASIYALAVRYEPFGLSILEAALSGCALVLGNVQSLREIWYGAAIFVPADDPEALESALDRLIKDPAERKELAGHAMERARRYTASRMAGSYLDLYQRTIDPPIWIGHEKGERPQVAAAHA